MILVLKPGLYMKRTGSIASRIWTMMQPTTIDFLLNRLFQQSRRSNSKGGSPAEPLILNDINGLGGSIMQRFFGAGLVVRPKNY